MVKKCIYCKFEISQDSVMDVCESCGHKVWGEKMFAAIVSNMENAREVGDLFQGSVSYPAVNQNEKSQNLLRSQSSPINQMQEKSQNSSSSLFDEAMQSSSIINDSQESFPSDSEIINL